MPCLRKYVTGARFESFKTKQIITLVYFQFCTLHFVLKVQDVNVQLPVLLPCCCLLLCCPAMMDFILLKSQALVNASFYKLPWLWCFIIATET